MTFTECLSHVDKNNPFCDFEAPSVTLLVEGLNTFHPELKEAFFLFPDFVGTYTLIRGSTRLRHTLSELVEYICTSHKETELAVPAGVDAITADAAAFLHAWCEDNRIYVRTRCALSEDEGAPTFAGVASVEVHVIHGSRDGRQHKQLTFPDVGEPRPLTESEKATIREHKARLEAGEFA